MGGHSNKYPSCAKPRPLCVITISMSDIKKLSSEDIGYAAAKAGLGSIPIVGALASEILGLIITPPLEKRRQKWMTEVGDKLKQLEDQDKIDLTTLASNEQFIDAVLIATSLAIKTCEDEKIKAFQNAILNTALGESPDKTKVQIFLTLLDNFTIWHIKILHFINNPKNGLQMRILNPRECSWEVSLVS